MDILCNALKKERVNMSKLIQIKFIHFYASRIVNYQIIYRTYGYAEYAEYAAGAAT